jgi:hypothetical protein
LELLCITPYNEDATGEGQTSVSLELFLVGISFLQRLDLFARLVGAAGTAGVVDSDALIVSVG